MFVDYSYTDVTVSPDSTDDTTDDTEDTTDTTDTNMWLFISSLVIAIALIIAVIGLIVQKIVRKAHIRKARAAAAASPNASRRRYPMKKAAEAPAEEKKRNPPSRKKNRTTATRMTIDSPSSGLNDTFEFPLSPFGRAEIFFLHRFVRRRKGHN